MQRNRNNVVDVDGDVCAAQTSLLLGLFARFSARRHLRHGGGDVLDHHVRRAARLRDVTGAGPERPARLLVGFAASHHLVG